MFQLHDKLLRFPLFQGMAYNDLMELVTHTKLYFHKLKEGETVVSRGDKCDKLHLLESGTLSAVTTSDDGEYYMQETMNAPYTLQPERLFGLDQRFITTFKALTDVSLISIDKQEIVRLMDELSIIRINFVNMATAMAQKAQFRTWQNPPKTLEERIILFIKAHCIHPTGQKTLRIRMMRLAEELNDSRIDVSRALNRMQAQGVLSLSRLHIVIPAVERLTD